MTKNQLKIFYAHFAPSIPDYYTYEHFWEEVKKIHEDKNAIFRIKILKRENIYTATKDLENIFEWIDSGEIK